MVRLQFFILLVLGVSSCSKYSKDQRLFAGVWEIDEFITYTYENNKEVSSSDTTFKAVMQLQNNDALSNNAFFEDWSPFGVSECNWDISEKKSKVINFHNFNMETGTNLFSYKMNVEKITRNRLVLVTYFSDDSLNVDIKNVWKFKKI